MGIFDGLFGDPFGTARQAEAARYRQQRIAAQFGLLESLFEPYIAVEPPASVAELHRQRERIERMTAEALGLPEELLGKPPRKVVESRVLSPTEVARRQITGAVQAVKDAQTGDPD